jgi:hypothetical protein
MRKREGLLGCALSCVLGSIAPSCTGTETDNPVVDFARTGCKNRADGAGTLESVGRAASALTLDRADYNGLYCFAWDAREDDRLRIDVLNAVGSCHVDWALGASRLDSGGLALAVQNNECAIAACGSCAYDFEFDVGGVDRTAPLRLEFSQLDCEGKPARDATTVTLPIDERPQGVVCQEGGRGLANLLLSCGSPWFPPCASSEGRPNGPGRCDSPIACDPGLICEPRTEQAFDMCLRACETDADCALDVEFCDAGACRLRDTF